MVSEELVIHQPDQDGQLQHDDDGEQQLVGYHLSGHRAKNLSAFA